MTTTIYGITVASGSTAPTAAQVVAGVNYGAVTVLGAASAAYSAAGAYDLTPLVSGLSASTAYDVYFAAYDGTTYSAVLSGTVTTASGLSATPGSYTWSGTQSEVPLQIQATLGVYSWAGTASQVPTQIIAAPGAYSWSGTQSEVPAQIIASPGTWTWAGLTSTFGGGLNASVGLYTWAGTTSAVPLLINATPAIYTWAGTTANFALSVQATPGTYTWAGVAAVIPASVSATIGVYTWAGRTATFGATATKSTIRSRFDAAPLQTQVDSTDPRWRNWFQSVWELVNARALPLPSAITLGASPYTYQFHYAGTASVLLSGGTVSLVEWSRDNVTWFTVGTSSPGMFHMSQNDFLRVTYTVAPTMTLVFR